MPGSRPMIFPVKPEALMTVQTFRDLLRRQPFQPFRLTMTDGRTFDVRYRARAFLTRSELLVGTGDAKDEIPEEFKICPLSHITAVEPLDPAGPKPAEFP